MAPSNQAQTRREVGRSRTFVATGRRRRRETGPQSLWWGPMAHLSTFSKVRKSVPPVSNTVSGGDGVGCDDIDGLSIWQVEEIVTGNGEASPIS
jgi:hypothetical protein